MLKEGKAKVFRRYPFTIIMQEREVQNCVTHPHRLKVDPWAKTTGIAILQGCIVVWAAELTHRRVMELVNSAGLINMAFLFVTVPNKKSIKDVRTGDILKAIVTKGKKVGTYLGRVATRASGSFNISTKNRLVQGISHKYCRIVHGKDGYQYK